MTTLAVLSMPFLLYTQPILCGPVIAAAVLIDTVKSTRKET